MNPTAEFVKSKAVEFAEGLADAEKILDEIRKMKLKEKPMTTTQGQIEKIRDQWVDSHRGKDETVMQARVRFWRANPEMVAKSRNAAPDSKTEQAPTFGETVSAAIEKRARQYHLDDPRTLDKSISELKVHILKSLPHWCGWNAIRSRLRSRSRLMSRASTRR